MNVVPVDIWAVTTVAMAVARCSKINMVVVIKTSHKGLKVTNNHTRREQPTVMAEVVVNTRVVLAEEEEGIRWVKEEAENQCNQDLKACHSTSSKQCQQCKHNPEWS